MTDISIDNSNLPRVKEVCRDFAVLEDHSLAHSLQEQEIEHHLATNIQRNRLVKKDLQVAKQLQEEEDLKAQAQIKHRHTQLVNLDGEIAQEIQDKLVIEAERRRRQEEKDEDIARLLQEKEERRRRKHAIEEPHYPDHEGHRRSRPKEHEYDRNHRHEKQERSRKEGDRPKSEQPSNHDDHRKRGRSAEPRSGHKDHHPDQRQNHVDRTSANKDKPQRPPPPRTSRHEDQDDEEIGACSSENLPRRGRSHSHDLLSSNHDDRRHRHSPTSRSDKRAERDSDYKKHRRRTPSPHNARPPRDGGYRSKGHREDPQGRPRRNYEDDDGDAKIARKLQEEELRLNTVDYRTAQLAQDEEIARWLMEKEEKSYKKSRGRDKMSDKRRADELEANLHSHGRPRSKDEHHRSRSDKPYRPLPPPPDEEFNGEHSHSSQRSSHSSPHSSSKSPHSHKGSHSRQ